MEEATSDSVVIVPWFSMAEWKEVYKQIYSNDKNLQQMGYERLLVWKARCSSLPAGVECTLTLMQVHLYNQEVYPQILSGQLPAYREQDLRLLYATAIMRFVNHISGVANQSATLYEMARYLHLPPWIINIRHSLAHAMTMPPLSALREALEIAFAWIHENYWKDETEVTSDYVALENFDSSDNKQVTSKLIYLIELWQALKLYVQVGFDDMNSIPYEKLRSDIYDFLDSMNAQENRNDDPSTGSSAGRTANMATKEVLASMKLKITQFFQKNKHIFATDESLTTVLLEGETFLLSESLISLLNIDETDSEANLASKLCVLWEELLRLLQDVNLLPSLLVKLIVLSGQKGESPHRRKMAALWVREICRGVAKAKQMENAKAITKEEWSSNHKISFESDLGKFNLRNTFQKHYPDLASAITLRLVNLPIVDFDLVKLAMNEPSAYTKIFLPRLLKLVEPALSKTCQANLFKVLNIYTTNSEGLQMKPIDPFTPFTVESLKALMGDQETEDSSANKVSADPEPVDSDGHGTWSRCEDYHDWEMCPIGILPWQRHLRLVEFSLPAETVWTAKQANSGSEDTCVVERDLRAKKIDFDGFGNKKKKFRGELVMPSKK